MMCRVKRRTRWLRSLPSDVIGELITQSVGCPSHSRFVRMSGLSVHSIRLRGRVAQVRVGFWARTWDQECLPGRMARARGGSLHDKTVGRPTRRVLCDGWVHGFTDSVAMSALLYACADADWVDTSEKWRWSNRHYAFAERGPLLVNAQRPATIKTNGACAACQLTTIV